MTERTGQKILDEMTQNFAVATVHLEGMKAFRVRLNARIQA